mgnify:CR=1 FL=1
MDHLALKMKGPLKMFMERFGEFVREDDYQQFFSNRRQNGRDTYLSSDFRRADKLSSVILEEYGVRNKLGGNVIFVIPDPAYDVPFYMFQLGGNGGSHDAYPGYGHIRSPARTAKGSRFSAGGIGQSYDTL